jgi:hypothetical protein
MKRTLRKMKKRNHQRNPINLKTKMKTINQVLMKVNLVRLHVLSAKKR